MHIYKLSKTAPFLYKTEASDDPSLESADSDIFKFVKKIRKFLDNSSFFLNNLAKKFNDFLERNAILKTSLYFLFAISSIIERIITFGFEESQLIERFSNKELKYLSEFMYSFEHSIRSDGSSEKIRASLYV